MQIAKAISDDANQALKLRELFVDDPEMVPGLLTRAPLGSQPATALSSYDTRTTTNRKVRCALCKSRQHHNRGFVVKLDSGDSVLIGKDCGETHFGDGAFAQITNDLDRRQEAALYELRTVPMLHALEEMRSLLAQWELATRRLAAHFTNVRTSFPPLWKRLVIAAKIDGGDLVQTREFQIGAVGRGGDISSRRDFQRKVVGRIPCPEIFLGQSPGALLRDANTRMAAARATLAGEPPPIKRKEAFAILRKVRQTLSEAERLHLSALSLLDPSWWELVISWADGECGEYLVDKRTMYGWPEGIQVEIAIPLSGETGRPLGQEVDALWPDFSAR